MSESAITIRELSYHYRGTPGYALSDINLEVGRGEFLVVMGPSEAGKSTLAACINGLIPHFHKGRFHGEVNVYGRNTCDHTVAQMSELVGLVFQDFEAQIFSTNVELEVAFGPENFALPLDEIASRVNEGLAYVGLEAFRNRAPATLSGGQKQKLAIASVLAMHPRVLVMDEPTTDLDPISKQGIFEITGRLRRRDDIAMIVVEHETEEVLHADRIALIKDGKLVRLGPADEVLRDVDLMESLGLMPLGVPRFFKSMGCHNLPLTPEEGVKAFREAGWGISPERYSQVVAADTVTSRLGEEPVIQCRGLEHTYPSGVKALDGVDLEIYRGEMVAIVGQNGSGKTTLAKHFNGLLYPTGGSISVHGLPTQEQGVFKLGQKVGYVFQNPDHQIFSETVFDEVAFGPRLSGLAEEEITRRVQEALEAVGLSGYEEQDPFSLTKSGRQRVAVAGVLASRPEVLILDEPTTGLDYAEQRGLMELVKRLNENGSTIIFITHHMWVVAEYARKVFVIKDGRLFLQGTTRQVFSHESELAEACLRPPHFVQFTNRLGMTMLRPQELAACIDGAIR
jgi:energy-coupling factor transport system ATP-binding protein